MQRRIFLSVLRMNFQIVFTRFLRYNAWHGIDKHIKTHTFHHWRMSWIRCNRGNDGNESEKSVESHLKVTMMRNSKISRKFRNEAAKENNKQMGTVSVEINAKAGALIAIRTSVYAKNVICEAINEHEHAIMLILFHIFFSLESPFSTRLSVPCVKRSHILLPRSRAYSLFARIIFCSVPQSSYYCVM